MAENFRRGRIVEVVKRLMWRRDMCGKQLDDQQYSEIRAQILGQMQTYDHVIRELVREFDLTEDDFA